MSVPTSPLAAPPHAVDPGLRPPFSIGVVARRTVSLWAAHGTPLSVASLAFALPSIAIGLLRGPGDAAGPRLDTVEVVVAVAALLATLAALAAGALQALAGDPPRAGALVRAGLRAIPRVLAPSVGAVLASLVGGVAGVAAWSSLRGAATGTPSAVVLGFWLVLVAVFVALTAAALAAFSGFLVAAAAAVGEPELGAVWGAALRAWRLAGGRRLGVLAVGLGPIASLALVGIASRLAGATTGAAWYAWSAAVSIGSIVPVGIAFTLPAVAYHHLRVEKEGVHPEAVARVFD